jgi:8-oxo-dGTP pyrophosphatase MutT (NUDIX family)
MSRVVVAIIRKLENDIDKYLLVKSKRDFGEHTGKFYPPSGHVEDGESDEMTIQRELLEELNIKIKPAQKIAEFEGDLVEITSWWLCDVVDDTQFKINDSELAEAQYFTKDEMHQKDLWPATEKFFSEYI